MNFLACCFLGAQRRREDPFQLTPLGPLPNPPRRGTKYDKQRQRPAARRPRPTAGSCSARRQHSSWPGPYARRPSEDVHGLLGSENHSYFNNNDTSSAHRAEVDARELFRQAGLPAPDFGGYYDTSVPMTTTAVAASQGPALVKFETPRVAPAPPMTTAAAETRTYGRGSSYATPPFSSSRHDGELRRRRRRGPEASEPSSGRGADEHRDKKRRHDDYRGYHSDHQARGDPRHVRSARGSSSSRHQPQSYRSVQTGGGGGVMSAVLGHKAASSSKRQRCREEREKDKNPNEQQRRQRASEEYTRKQERARVQQRGREREREREWHTSKQMELRGLLEWPATGTEAQARLFGSGSRTRQRTRSREVAGRYGGFV